jgi:hypothetical protein
LLIGSEFIQAGIDGELTADEQSALAKLLEESAEARTLDQELRALSEALAAEPPIELPPGLHEAVLRSAAQTMNTPHSQAPTRSPPPAGPQGWRGALIALRYVGAFAAGLLVTAFLYELGTPPPTEDFSGLAGSMLSADALTTSSVDGFELSSEAVTGRVDLRQGHTVLVVDFELDSAGPVEVTLSYGEEGLGFGGFAQVENELSDVQVANGQIRLINEGQHRFAVFFRDSGEEAARVALSFKASGELIHEQTLTTEQ